MSGAQELAALARELKRAGDGKTLRRELYRGIGRAVKPVTAELKVSARATLPGGLGDWTAEKLGTSRKIRTGARTAGVQITVQRRNPRASGGKSDVSALNRGRARHLTWGHKPWHLQPVPRGFVDEVAAGPLTKRAASEIGDVVDRIKARIVRA